LKQFESCPVLGRSIPKLELNALRYEFMRSAPDASGIVPDSPEHA